MTKQDIQSGILPDHFPYPGLRHGRGSSELHAYGTPSKRLRWVAEISYHGHRYRFRSTNYNNARRWLDDMINKFNWHNND